MSDLAELYRRTPRLESPEKLDNAVLAYARRKAPVPARSVWYTWAPAVSMACVSILGLTLVLRNGAPPLTGTSTNAIEPAAEVDDLYLVTPSVTSLEESIAEPPGDSATPDAGTFPPMVTDENVALIPKKATSEKAAAQEAVTQGVTPPVSTGPVVTADTVSAGVVQQKRKLSTAVDVSDRAAEPQVRATVSLRASENEAASDQMMSAESAIVSDTSIQQSPGPDWLMSQPEDNFTMRVAVSSDRSALEKLARELSTIVIFEPVFLQSDVQGWVLVSGSFSSRNTAVELLNQLDVAAGAEVISFKDLKSELF